jgi:prolyl oligopeptidase
MSLATPLHAPVEELVHGSIVRDPFRWLEDRNLPETEDWIIDQQRRCEEYFSNLGDLNALRKQVRDYLDIESIDQPSRVAGKFFYRRRNRGQEQPSIYVRNTQSEYERLLVDPSTLGSFTSASIYRISGDGSLLAFELKYGGSDQKAIRILNVETGDTLPDKIETGYARGFAFAEDRQGFYYCHDTSPSSKEHEVRFHHLDRLVEDQIIFRVARTQGSRLVLIADKVHLGIVLVHRKAEGSAGVADFYIAKVSAPTNWQKLIDNRRLPYHPILKHGRIFVISYVDAPNGKMVELNTAGSEIRMIIPEQNAILRQLVVTKDRIYGSYLFDLDFSVRWWSLSGASTGTVDIPPEGTIQLAPNHSESESDLFYTHESFVHPPQIFQYTPNAGSRLRPRPSISDRRPPSLLHASFASKDETKIPIVLVTPASWTRGSACPVLMTGYGGFGVSMTPQYSVLVSVLVALGVAFALPQIRGGGEFGRKWHESARARNRQTAFDDFIAAAEWVSPAGRTDRVQLGIFGGSNSGLLVCAAMTQRPDLFGAVLSVAPLLDMVRYEQFDQAARWSDEYGSVENEEEFKALYAYSPYHQVKEGIDYPPTLFVTGDKDDRCNPAHVRKMAALLQQQLAQTRPVIVDYSADRGHAPVMPLSVRVEALVRRIAFFCRELSIPMPGGGPDEAVGS